jgi:hypothetical protein
MTCRCCKLLGVKLLCILLVLVVLSPGGFTQRARGLRVSDATRFVAAHGRRAWAAGYANRGLEVWAGALQIATDVRPEFRRSGDVTAMSGESLVVTVAVYPSHICRTYTGPDFSVEEQTWVPVDKPAVLLRYTVRSSRPLQVILRFQPSLNLMWPAALGGQEIHWDPTQSAYSLTEPAQQFAAAVLVPNAKAHDEPLNVARSVADRDQIAVELDPNSPEVLFTRLRGGKASSPAGLTINDAQQLLRSSRWQQESDKHYDAVLSSGLQIETPDAELNQALAWAAVALDQDWFCNDDLGCAYVAGYGPSRRSRRPQYAWFFAGDGMIALHAALARGDLERVRDEIRFLAKYQDPQTGMMWHELSQSALYLDWRGKYPYMFEHADLTYPYISTVADYLRASDDRAFLRELWPSVQKAFAFGRSLVNRDGLPRIPEGKQGADEQVPHSDELSLSASWIAACRDYAHLAGLMGEAEAARDAQQLAERARSSFAQRYWDQKKRVPIDAYSRTGEPVQDRGLGAITAIDQQLFSPEQSNHVLDSLASWQFQSDWGTRSVGVGSPGYDPTGYAHGSVWALGTADVAQAYWQGHRPDIAWQIWRKLVPWSTLDSPGHMHEVLAGDTYHPQEESVPEQTWSSAAFLSTAVHGLFGLEVNAETGIVTLAPHFPPDWKHAGLNSVRMGSAKLDFAFEQTVNQLVAHIQTSGAPVHLHFAPQLPLGSRVLSASVCGHPSTVHMQSGAEDTHAILDFIAPKGNCELAIHYRAGVSIILPQPRPSPGDVSTSPELTSVVLDGNSLHVGLDIIPARENRVWIRTERSVVRATPATVESAGEHTYAVKLPSTPESSSFQHLEISVTLGK